MKLTLGQIADWIHADGEFDTSAEAVGYAIDSRTIGAGELFFAVRGERLDGHEYVQAALTNLMKGRTVFVIAHRLSTVRRATRIAVIESGQIGEIGTHDELMQHSGTYRRLYNLQFSESDVPPVDGGEATLALGLEGIA